MPPSENPLEEAYTGVSTASPCQVPRSFVPSSLPPWGPRRLSLFTSPNPTPASLPPSPFLSPSLGVPPAPPPAATRGGGRRPPRSPQPPPRSLTVDAGGDPPAAVAAQQQVGPEAGGSRSPRHGSPCSAPLGAAERAGSCSPANRASRLAHWLREGGEPPRRCLSYLFFYFFLHNGH